MTRSVWAWARVLGGAAIIGVLAWKLGTGAFLDGLRVVGPGTLLAALAIGFATTLLSAWRWCLVARGLGLRLRLGDAIAEYYRALFLNAALPGGVLGDVDRAVQHGRDTGNVGKGVRAVVLERTAGQIVLVAVGVTVLLTAPSPVRGHLQPHGPALAVAGVAGAVLLAAVLLAGRRLGRGASRSATAIRDALAEIRAGLLHRRTWHGVALASAGVLAGHLATFVVAARAAGSAASLPRLAPLMLLALLAMSLPVNIGGWGPREGVTAWAFGAAGLSAAQGLTVAVVYGLFAFVAAVPGAALLLVGGAARARARAAARAADRAVPASATRPARVVVVEKAPVPASPVGAAPAGAAPVTASPVTSGVLAASAA
ncbi:lysylphosphatidylglycerol synthase transmembrane domain-containing protein [Mangrovihabitans endophyticus]|uniref:Lysylphosphatidylglycerol synthase TM region n=1 Tax=Mangrovihabitans endophyticus TaxID=1751298 RepID=A0A8J3C4C7_9ACTN|nr:lysylphosphatidylglycerol synthase transmembrane domain-containing protein [Mangrovihabitans endophyticus]GGL07788.1 hypothetical protein GCM10012284_47770 [Mangrovihabitans endophyticus]